MKKTLLALFLAASALTFSFATTGDEVPINSSEQGDYETDSDQEICYDLKKNLGPVNTGTYRNADRYTNGEVTKVQQFLHDEGFLIPEPTGFFGPKTRAAAIQYQRSKGFTILSGYVGPKSREAIKTDTCNGIALNDVAVACTMEARLCEDGTYVSRTGPHCAFAACPNDVTEINPTNVQSTRLQGNSTCTVSTYTPGVLTNSAAAAAGTCAITLSWPLIVSDLSSKVLKWQFTNGTTWFGNTYLTDSSLSSKSKTFTIGKTPVKVAIFANGNEFATKTLSSVCATGAARDTSTGRCLASSSGTVTATSCLALGKIINTSGTSCTSCPADSTPNTEGTACVGNYPGPACTITGQTKNSSGVCSCPSGQVVSGNACAPTAAVACTITGQTKNSSGVCVCPTGQAVSGNSCVTVTTGSPTAENINVSGKPGTICAVNETQRGSSPFQNVYTRDAGGNLTLKETCQGNVGRQTGFSSLGIQCQDGGSANAPYATCAGAGQTFINGNSTTWLGNKSGYCYADSACDNGYKCSGSPSNTCVLRTQSSSDWNVERPSGAQYEDLAYYNRTYSESVKGWGAWVFDKCKHGTHPEGGKQCVANKRSCDKAFTFEGVTSYASGTQNYNNGWLACDFKRDSNYNSPICPSGFVSPRNGQNYGSECIPLVKSCTLNNNYPSIYPRGTDVATGLQSFSGYSGYGDCEARCNVGYELRTKVNHNPNDTNSTTYSPTNAERTFNLGTNSRPEWSASISYCVPSGTSRSPDFTFTNSYGKAGTISVPDGDSVTLMWSQKTSSSAVSCSGSKGGQNWSGYAPTAPGWDGTKPLTGSFTVPASSMFSIYSNEASYLLTCTGAGNEQVSKPVMLKKVNACSSGTSWNGYSCTVGGVQSCVGGTHLEGGSCVSCPTGKVWDGSSCVVQTTCPSGQNWDSLSSSCMVSTFNFVYVSGATAPAAGQTAKCTIPVGGNSCSISVSWDPKGVISYSKRFAYGGMSGSATTLTGPGSHTFTINPSTPQSSRGLLLESEVRNTSAGVGGSGGGSLSSYGFEAVCQTGGSWNGTSCVSGAVSSCTNGAHLVGGSCVSCSSNQTWNSSSASCVTTCSANEILVGSVCVPNTGSATTPAVPSISASPSSITTSQPMTLMVTDNTNLANSNTLYNIRVTGTTGPTLDTTGASKGLTVYPSTTVLPLTAGNTYTFQIRACIASVCSAWSGNSQSVTITSGSVATASAWISAPNCSIPANQSTCTSNVTWGSSNLNSTLYVRQGAIQFSTDPSSSGVARTLYYGSGNSNHFDLYHNGVKMHESHATVTCSTGTTWDGSKCAAAVVATIPTLSLTAAGQTVNPGATVNVGADRKKSFAWTSSDPTASCVLNGVAVAYQGTVESVDLTSGNHYFTCTNSAGTGSLQFNIAVASVTVVPITLSLSANGITVAEGSTVTAPNGVATFTWSNTGATSCVLNGVSLPMSGSATSYNLTPGTHYYTCTNSTGSKTMTFTINTTVAVAKAVTMTMSPKYVRKGVPTSADFAYSANFQVSSCEVKLNGVVVSAAMAEQSHAWHWDHAQQDSHLVTVTCKDTSGVAAPAASATLTACKGYVLAGDAGCDSAGSAPFAIASRDISSTLASIGNSLRNTFSSINKTVADQGLAVANVLSGATGASASSGTCTNITSNLHRGYETASVLKLQTFLISKGLLSEKASGFFGDLTIEAVKAYQRSVGLPQTGMVYNATREAIMVESCQ